MRYLIALLSIILIGCNGAEGEKIAAEIEKRVSGELKTYKYKYIENDGQSRGIIHYALVMDCDFDECKLNGWLQGWITNAVPERAHRGEVKATLMRNGDIYEGVIIGITGCVMELYDIEVNFDNAMVTLRNKRWTPGTYDRGFYSEDFTGGALDQWGYDYSVGCVDLY